MIPEEIRIDWYTLCATAQPRLPREFAQVAGTFTDPALPTAQLPSKTLIRFFERRVKTSPPLSALALVAMAGLTQAGPARVLSVIQAVDEFVRLVASLVPGEVQPDIHYRIGYLEQNRPETMVPAQCQSLVTAYETATTWVNDWEARHPGSAVLQHRLPGFQDRARWIAQWLPRELEPEIEFFNTVREGDDDGFTSTGLRHLCDNVIAAEVPWARHLVVMFALAEPQRRKQKRFAEDISTIHRLLLDRWNQAKFRKDMSAILNFSPPDEDAVRVIKRHTRFMRDTVNTVQKHRREDLLPYVFDIPQLDRQQARNWEALEGSLDEKLYHWCRQRLPETASDFPHFAFLLPILERNSGHPFYPHLVLMAVGLATDPKKRGVPTAEKYLRNVAFRLDLLLKALSIDVPKFVPDVHFARYLKLAGNEDEELEEKSADKWTPQIARILNRDYEACTRAVEDLFARTGSTQAVQEWQLLPLTPEVRAGLVTWTSDAAVQERRERDTDLVIDHWGDLHCLAEARAIAARHLMQACREAEQQSGPYPRELTVTLPLCSQRWHFLQWDTESYVRQHPEVFGADARWLATNVASDTPFLEWTQVTNLEQTEAIRPWFADLLAYQNVREEKRQGFLTRTGYTEASFIKSYTYPALKPEALKRMFMVAADSALQRGEDPPCLFEPNELYSDVLTGLLQLRIIRVNGGRQHELLQIRLEKEYFWHTEQGCIVRIQPKGRKLHPDPARRWEERFLSDRAVFIVEDLLKLQVRNEGKFVRTRVKNVALKGNPPGKYLFNNGKSMLSAQEFTRRLRFLTFGWDRVVTQKRLSLLRTHELRYGFTNKMAAGGFRMSSIASILGHMHERMTEQYARLTLAAQQAAQKEFDRLIDGSETTPQQVIQLGFVELRTEGKPVRRQLTIPPVLKELYELEDQARALEVSPPEALNA